MNRLGRTIVTAGVLTGLGFAAYELLLNDEAKAGVRKLVNAVKDSYNKLSEVVSSITGEVMDDDGTLPNVQATEQQWDALGY